MAESNYTYGCGKFLPGYGPGNQLDFVPPGSVGTPDGPDPVDHFICFPTSITTSTSFVVLEDGGTMQTDLWIVTQNCIDKKSIEFATAVTVAINSWDIILDKLKNGFSLGFATPAGLNSFLVSFGQPCTGLCFNFTLVTTKITPGVDLLTLTCTGPTEGGVVDVPTTFDLLLDKVNKADRIEVTWDDPLPDGVVPVPAGEAAFQIDHTFIDADTYNVVATAYNGPDQVAVSDPFEITIVAPIPDVTIAIDHDIPLVTNTNLDFYYTISESNKIDKIVANYGNGTVNTVTTFTDKVFSDVVSFDTVGPTTLSVIGYFNNVQIATASKVLQVDENPVSMVINPVPTGAISPGDTVTYTAVVTGGSGSYNYVWFIDGELQNEFGIEFTKTYPVDAPKKTSYLVTCIAYQGGSSIVQAEITTTVTLTEPGGGN